MCVPPLVEDLAEISVKKQNIVTPPRPRPTTPAQLRPRPGGGKAQGAQRDNILVRPGPQNVRDIDTSWGEPWYYESMLTYTSALCERFGRSHTHRLGTPSVSPEFSSTSLSSVHTPWPCISECSGLSTPRGG